MRPTSLRWCCATGCAETRLTMPAARRGSNGRSQPLKAVFFPRSGMDDLGSLRGLPPRLTGAPPDTWQDALLAARIFAHCGPKIGGLWLKARAGGVRDAFLDHLGALTGRESWIRVPPSVSLCALTGGIDLPATTLAGRLVYRPGLLEKACGGVLLIPMAERLEAPVAALIGAAIDTADPGSGSDDQRARFSLIAIDECAGPDEHPPAALADRLGLIVDLNAVSWHQVKVPSEPVSADRPPLIGNVLVDDRDLELLSVLAQAAGAPSLRMLRHLHVICRMIAALNGRDSVSQPDILTALRLGLGVEFCPQPERLPEQAASEQQEEHAALPDCPESQEADGTAEDPLQVSQALSQLCDLDAAPTEGTIAGLPEFVASQAQASPRAAAGKSGAARKDARRGRPVSTSRSAPYPDARPHLIATLRAAAPWQAIRSRNRQLLAERLSNSPRRPVRAPRILVTKEDYRFQRLRHETPSTAIFLVDASGSTALERLGETKGAIEQLLARCYVRRDEVAMISFRGTGAETVLSPTRSLVQAKRRLAGLPGGGATPLVAGLQRGLEMAVGVRRQGSTPILVLLTDGRGNIALDGTPDRHRAADELNGLATKCRALQIRCLCIDIARRPREAVATLAETMGAQLHVLRHADARQMSDVVNLSLQETRA
ncbi:VWA domain-containing protein [Rhodobacterales bacterium]|nr:VWA domain-containing protein [Rhodobacterales bacterium]